MQLPSLLGNPRLKAAFARLPQAPGVPILLCGPQGSGKRTAARDWAAGLLCRSPQGPCGRCPACIEMGAGSHPDFYQLPYEGQAVKLDQVRDLRARTFLKSHIHPFKVFVIHAADRLSPACQNALLRVLEEAPNCAFMLLCENREALLQTVRSRCAAYGMEPLGRPALEAALKARGAQGDLEAALDFSGGFLGQALDFLAGSEPAFQASARAFDRALDQGELAVYRACLEAAALGRESYPDFILAARRALAQRVAATGDGRWAAIDSYLTEQQELLPNNPALAALSGGLAAFCGRALGLQPAPGSQKGTRIL